jgi:2'-5' RNA ligase
MRLFIGIEIPDEVKEELLLLQESRFPFSWQSWDQFHLTLHFLGTQHHLTVRELTNHLQSFSFTPFDLTLKGGEVFGSGNSSHRVCVRSEFNEDLNQLQKNTGKRIRNLKIQLERNYFNPHVTLARFGRNSKLKGVGEFLVQNSLFKSRGFPVAHFSLFESTPGPNGSIYTVVERFGSVRDVYDEWGDAV